MAISRLIAANSELHLKNKANFLTPRRWCSSVVYPSPSQPPPSSSSSSVSPPPSSSSSSPNEVPKETESVKENKSEAIKSFIEKYMLKHPGVFPKAKEIRNEVGGSWSILKDVVTEMKKKIRLVSQVDKEIAVEAQATEMEENMDRRKIERPEEVFPLLTEVDEAKPHSKEVEDSEVLETVKISDSTEHPEPKQLERVILSPMSSETVLGQQLSDTSSHIVEEENTCESISDTNPSELKLTEASTSGTDVNCQELNENSLAIETTSSTKMGFNLVEIFKQDAEKGKELNGKNISSLEHEICSDLKEDERDVISLVDVLKRNSKDLGDASLISEEQKRSVNPKEAGGEDFESSDVKGLLDRIIELSKDTLKTGPWLPSNKINKQNRELKGFVNKSTAHVTSNEEHDSSNHHDKTKARKSKVQAETSNVVNTSNSVVKKDSGEGKKSSSYEVKKRMLQLDKDKKTVDPQDINYSQLTEESDSDIEAFDYTKAKSSNEVHLLVQDVNLKASPLEEMSSHKNNLLVKFLVKIANENDVAHVFGDCGPITEIRVVKSRRENRFNYAYICFKTEEGLRKALSKNDMAICGEDVIVEPAFPSEGLNSVFNVGPVKDADFPVAFLKNPNRTVMVKGLQDSLSFHNLRCAFSSWGRVSGFAMGRSFSNVYVEFESEESKERVLAEGAITVMGKKLPVHRVNSPTTTVVRILNVNPVSGIEKVRSICDSYGRVKRVVGRDTDIIDVHFKSSEWTNMVKILNRLNGLVVDYHQWQAQPATVLPVEVLQALWNQPEGRKQVHELVQKLCKRIGEKSINMAPMLGLAQEYYVES